MYYVLLMRNKWMDELLYLPFNVVFLFIVYRLIFYGLLLEQLSVASLRQH